MNIDRLSSVSASAQPLQPKPTVADAPTQASDTRPHAPHSTLPQDGKPAEGSVGYGRGLSQRVANFAGRIEKRLQHAIDRGNLSDEQVQALKAAAAKFQSQMNRIGDVNISHLPKREAHIALHELSQQFHAILNPEGQGLPSSLAIGGPIIAAAPSAPSIDTTA